MGAKRPPCRRCLLSDDVNRAAYATIADYIASLDPERKVDEAEGRAEALGLGANPKTLEDEIAELRASDRVDAELAALKARLNKGE